MNLLSRGNEKIGNDIYAFNLGTARKQPLERSLDSWSGHLARFHA